jgi:hypothetical protein
LGTEESKIVEELINAVITEIYNDKTIKKECHKALSKFGGVYQKDYDDFYSRIGVELNVARKKYGKDLLDSGQAFSKKDCRKYLVGVIHFSVYKEMTNRNRKKRMMILEVEEPDSMGKLTKKKSYVSTISIETPVKNLDSTTIGDMISNTETVEDTEFFFEEDIFDERILEYLHRLSKLQKEVLRLMILGYSSEEIKRILHITGRKYNDCIAAIRSDRNTSILL